MRTSLLPLGLLGLALSVVGTGCVGSSASDDAASQGAALSVKELRGVDSAGAFSAADAKKLKEEYGVAWTGVYIGGKCSGGSGWSKSVVTEIANATGFTFMPTYVGQEAAASCGGRSPVLTEAQGVADAHDTASRMSAFGWAAKRDIPVSLDIEENTFEDSPSATVDYVRGWVNEVRSLGYLPYVYSSPSAINELASAHVDIAGVWVASYFYASFEKVTPSDLHQIGSNFSKQNRAWQYAGNVFLPSIGTHVDCNASDLLLAPAPGGTNAGGGSSSSGGGTTSGGGGSSPPPAAPDACSKGDGFCTETLQCDSGHWIIRQDDAAKCTVIENVSEACKEGNGYCTKTLQCDGGHWVPRAGDASKCTSGPGA